MKKLLSQKECHFNSPVESYRSYISIARAFSTRQSPFLDVKSDKLHLVEEPFQSILKNILQRFNRLLMSALYTWHKLINEPSLTPPYPNSDLNPNDQLFVYLYDKIFSKEYFFRSLFIDRLYSDTHTQKNTLSSRDLTIPLKWNPEKKETSFSEIKSWKHFLADSLSDLQNAQGILSSASNNLCISKKKLLESQTFLTFITGKDTMTDTERKNMEIVGKDRDGNLLWESNLLEDSIQYTPLMIQRLLDYFETRLLPKDTHYKHTPIVLKPEELTNTPLTLFIQEKLCYFTQQLSLWDIGHLELLELHHHQNSKLLLPLPVDHMMSKIFKFQIITNNDSSYLDPLFTQYLWPNKDKKEALIFVDQLLLIYPNAFEQMGKHIHKHSDYHDILNWFYYKNLKTLNLWIQNGYIQIEDLKHAPKPKALPQETFLHLIAINNIKTLSNWVENGAVPTQELDQIYNGFNESVLMYICRYHPRKIEDWLKSKHLSILSEQCLKTLDEYHPKIVQKWKQSPMIALNFNVTGASQLSLLP